MYDSADHRGDGVLISTKNTIEAIISYLMANYVFVSLVPIYSNTVPKLSCSC